MKGLTWWGRGRKSAPPEPAPEPAPTDFQRWALACMRHQAREHRNGFGVLPRAYFEFGTGTGGTLRSYLRAVAAFHRETGAPLQEFRVCCFDTFTGLPPSDDPADRHPVWTEGAFLGSRDHIASVVREEQFPLEQVRFVEGPFEQTLTAGLAEEFQAASCLPSLVTVDVDYYTSTRTVLDWLPPLLRSGVFFYFDDIFSFHGHPDMGQIKALEEFRGQGRGNFFAYNLFGLWHRSYVYSRPVWEYGRASEPAPQPRRKECP